MVDLGQPGRTQRSFSARRARKDFNKKTGWAVLVHARGMARQVHRTAKYLNVTGLLMPLTLSLPILVLP